MDQVFAKAGVIADDRLRTLALRFNARGWLQLGSHAAAIAVTGTGLVFTLGTWWAVPLFLMHGVLINYLYAGQHEFSHNTVFPSAGLNEWCGRIIGFILITPRDADQIQHFAHHRYTQRWRQDGELYRAPFTFRRYALRLSGLEYWYGNIRSLLLYAAGKVDEPYIRGSGVGKVVREARWHLAGYAVIAAASLATGSWAAVLLWLAPMLLTKPAHQLQNTIEHVGLPHNDNIFENTRSTRTNAIMRWMCWNMPYHTAHHAFPVVPCYRLKTLHHEIFTARGITPPTMGYFAFQAAVLKALWQKDEADYPDDIAWVSEEPAPAAAIQPAE